MERKPIDQSIIQRVVAGTKFIVSGVAPLGWFGPQQPIQPLAQDIDGVTGRQFDYQAGANINIQPKVTEGSGVSYPQLRQLADSLDILRLVIETRKDQLAAQDWNVVAKKDKLVSEEVLAQITASLRQPTAEYDWDMWLRMLLEDLFVLDAIAIYPRMTRGGGLYSLDLIDSATIKRVIDDGGRTPLPPDPAYQQILKGVPAVNYTSDELILRMRNPRTNRLYGFSPVEQIIMTVNIALRRQLTQLQYFTEGNIPEAFASVPDTWNPDQVSQFQLYFDSLLMGNTATRSRLKFLPLDTSKIKETRDPMLKDAFDEWLARIVCYAFNVPVSAFVKELNRATAGTAKETATAEGLIPLMVWVKRLMDFVIISRLGNADVEFTWRQDGAIDPLTQAQIDQIYVSAGIRSPEAIHAERGWEDEVMPPTQEEKATQEQAKNDAANAQAFALAAAKQPPITNSSEKPKQHASDHPASSTIN